jgi:hypothetical protein
MNVEFSLVFTAANTDRHLTYVSEVNGYLNWNSDFQSISLVLTELKDKGDAASHRLCQVRVIVLILFHYQ